MTIIDEFDLNPSTVTLTATSQSIKNCIENLNFKKLKEHPECKSELTQFAKKIIDFWNVAANSIGVLSQNEKITLFKAASVCYGLEACINWDQGCKAKGSKAFADDDWRVLRPAICKLMRKLINIIHKNDLLAVDGQKNAGDVMALVGWIVKGIKYKVPNFGKDGIVEAGSELIGLLSNFKRTADNPSLIDITQRAINYLLNSPIKAFDTRRLGKMVMQLGRMISIGDLGIQQTDKKPWIQPTALADKLVSFSQANLLTEYKQTGKVPSPGYVNPVAVTNLCEGLFIFFRNGILNWSSQDHQRIAIKVATFIQKAAREPQEGGSFEHYREVCTRFLTEAINNTSKESVGPFQTAMAALG